MTKKSSYLTLFVFVLITGTRYLDASEAAGKDSKKSAAVGKIMTQSEKDKQDARAAQLAMHFDSPCGANRVGSVLNDDDDTERRSKALLQLSSQQSWKPPSSDPHSGN